MSVGYWSTPIVEPDIRSTCNQLERVYVRQQQAVVESLSISREKKTKKELSIQAISQLSVRVCHETFFVARNHAIVPEYVVHMIPLYITHSKCCYTHNYYAQLYAICCKMLIKIP